MAYKVYLGVGHGGSDPGAVANGFQEKNLNLAIALACKQALDSQGVVTQISRTTDVDAELTQRIRQCNAFAPDLALDIHNNAGGGDGAEVYHHFGGGTGKALAQNILAELVAIGQNSRGPKIRLNSGGTDYFGFIRQTNAPAVIVECAFLDNTKDLQTVDTPAKQTAVGTAIAKGILKTLGVTPVQTEIKAEEKTQSVALPILQKGSAGNTVKAMQLLLVGWGYPCGSAGADGDFGSATDAAVRSFQRDNSLASDGICGLKTWSALLGLTGGSA